MKIITFARYEWDGTRYELVREESHEYQGPVARCGGGPSSQAIAASKASSDLSAQQAKTSADMLNYYKQAQAQITPYATNLMNTGLSWLGGPAGTDYLRGSLAQSYAPAWAGLNRQLSQAGGGSLPSGWAQTARSQLASQQARDFDSQQLGLRMQNEQAKQTGAQLLAGQQVSSNPLGWGQAAQGGYGDIMRLPPTSGIGGVLGGAFGSVMSAGGQAGGFGALF